MVNLQNELENLDPMNPELFQQTIVKWTQVNDFFISAAIR